MGVRTGNPKGRPKGAKNKKTKEREKLVNEQAKKLNEALGVNAFTGDAHALLMAVYKDESLPIKARLDAAVAAIGYEKPRLSSIDANIDATVGQYRSIPVERRESDMESAGGTPARSN